MDTPDLTRGAPGRIGELPPVLTWRYHRGDPDGTLRVVRAVRCILAAGRVTWFDHDERIVLSEPSSHVHHLACEQADGTADDRPAYADESGRCRWCTEAAARMSDVGPVMAADGHLVHCPRLG
jgi:hypothetical protein